MGNPVPISLGLRSNPYRKNKQVGAARLTNCFAQELGEEGKSQWVITGTPGLTAFGSALAGGGIRAMLVLDDQLLVVAGRSLYTVNASGVSVRLGGIPTDGPVYMRRNRRVPTQVGIVSDGYYAVLQSGALTEIADPDLPPPSSFAYLDGYGILPISRGRYMITGIDDFSSIDGLDEGVAESSPDEIVRAHELEREVYFFGTASIEAHQNTGDADFPFTRSQTMEVGCPSGAGGAVVAVDTPTGKALMFVAHDHTVRLIRGYQTNVISTGEIEDLIETLAEAGRLTELRASAWSSGGRNFAALSCDDWTRVFDATSGNWHDRASHLQDRWRVSEVISFAGKTIAGDWQTGQLYQMGERYYTEADEAHTLELIPPPIHAHPHRTRHNALHLDVARGVGLNTPSEPQDEEPTLLIDWSNDGGKTWSTPREVPLGRLGQDAKRLPPIRRLGKADAKGRHYRFRVSAAVEKIIISAALDFDQLTA
jgi:hypothetical protein